MSGASPPFNWTARCGPGSDASPIFWEIVGRTVSVTSWFDEICGVTIPRGTLVIPYLYGTHRNPDHWDDPERFDPGRFDREARQRRHKFAWAPFGGGPRVCVGNNMAIMQMLLIVATLVRRYDLEAAGPMPGIQPMKLLRPDGAAQLHFTPRG